MTENPIKRLTYRALRWSEKYTKTDMVYLASGNFWLTLNRITGVGAGIFFSVALANLLPKETFGTYRYVISAASFITAFTLTGMGVAITRTVAQGFEQILRPIVRRSMQWSIGAVLIAGSIATHYLIQGNLTLGISFILIAISMPFSALGVSKSFLQGKGDFRRLALYNLPRNIVSTIILVGICLFTTNPLAIIFGYFAINTLLTLGIYWNIKRVYRVELEKPLPLNIFNETEKYGKHMSVVGGISLMVSELDKLLLWHVAGPAALATYTFALAPIREIRNLLESTSVLAFPKFAQKSITQVKSTLKLRILQIFVVTSLVGFAYIMIAPLLFSFVFPKYHDAIPYTQILAILLLFQSRGLLTTVLTAHSKVREQYILTILDPLIRLPLYLVLIPIYGINGVIGAMILSEALNFLILLYMLKRLS